MTPTTENTIVREFELEKSVYVPLDPGRYQVRIVDLGLVEGRFGRQIQWSLELQNGEKTRAWTSDTYSAESNLGKWTQAILGRLPERFRPSDLIGKSAVAIVAVKLRDDGSETSRVTALTAATKQTRMALKAMPEPEPEPESDAASNEELPF